MRLRFTVPFLLLPLVAAGCSRGPLVREAPELERPSDFPNHTAEQVVRLMARVAEADSLHAFSSQARLQIRSPQRNADAEATFRQRGADTLWASVRGPLSIEVARLLATRDSFFIHDKLEGRLYAGSDAAASAYFPAPIAYDDLLPTLLGTLRPDPQTPWRLRHDPRYYYLEAPGGAELFIVDPATWRTVRYEQRAHGQVIDLRTFDAFDLVDGRVLPRRVTLQNPSEDLMLRLEHRQLRLNPTGLSFPFRPGSAERYPLD